MDIDPDDLPTPPIGKERPQSTEGIAAARQNEGRSKPLVRPIGLSFRKSYARRVADGFMDKYLSGAHILDIGFRGGDPHAVPITESAIGVELDYPGYDGVHLPFADDSQDAVLAAHVLEHIPDYQGALREWYRVLRVGGYLVLMVPHWHLFERRCDLPSRWNGDHKRFYTPSRLLAEIEASLPVNGHRIRHLFDNDFEFNYEQSLDRPPQGGYEIELVVEKIKRPSWADKVVYPAAAQQVVARLDGLIFQVIAAHLTDGEVGQKIFSVFVKELRYITPWNRLKQRFVSEGAPELNGSRVTEAALAEAVRPLLDRLSVDEAVYGSQSDLQAAIAAGRSLNLTAHWRTSGYFEGRVAHEYDVFPRPTLTN
jgi:SAM-dependent methyltransferase